MVRLVSSKSKVALAAGAALLLASSSSTGVEATRATLRGGRRAHGARTSKSRSAGALGSLLSLAALQNAAAFQAAAGHVAPAHQARAASFLAPHQHQRYVTMKALANPEDGEGEEGEQAERISRRAQLVKELAEGTGKVSFTLTFFPSW